MKVQKINIRNFKCLDKQNIELNGNSVYVMGKNASGKSSFIDAVFKIITGKDLPTQILKKDEEKGFIEITLDEYVIKAYFNNKKKGYSLSIENLDGTLEYKTPRKMLDNLAGIVDFDINNFLSLSPKKQVDFIKQIIGIDFTDMDNKYQELYDERTFINRQVKELEMELKDFILDETLNEIDVSSIQKQIEETQTTINKIDGIEGSLQERSDNIKYNEQRISELEKTIQELREKNNELIQKNNEAIVWLENNPKPDIEPLKEKFDLALKNNLEYEKNKEFIQKNKVFNEKLIKQEDINREMDSIQDYKKKILSDHEMPVTGLTFDEERLYSNGLPFERNQINTAQLIITGLQINLAILSDLRIARFDGSLLDHQNLKIVQDWAEKNDLQLFIEIVDRDKEGLKLEVQENVHVNNGSKKTKDNSNESSH